MYCSVESFHHAVFSDAHIGALQGLFNSQYINLFISGGLLSLWAFSNFIYGYWCSAKIFTPRFNYVYPWSAVSFITCSIVGYAQRCSVGGGDSFNPKLFNYIHICSMWIVLIRSTFIYIQISIFMVCGVLLSAQICIVELCRVLLTRSIQLSIFMVGGVFSQCHTLSDPPSLWVILTLPSHPEFFDNPPISKILHFFGENFLSHKLQSIVRKLN